MDRVVATHGSYFNLPASKEGFIPGAANLRLPRLVGIQLARQGIFFERKFFADTPEGQMIADEVVAYEQMDKAVEENTSQMIRAGFTSAVSNRKALRVAQEPLSDYRRYMATYARQQAMCVYDPKLIEESGAQLEARQPAHLATASPGSPGNPCGHWRSLFDGGRCAILTWKRSGTKAAA